LASKCVAMPFTDDVLGVGQSMDINMKEMKDELDEKWGLLGLRKGDATAEKVMELINREDFNASVGGTAPMIKLHPTSTVPDGPREA